MKIRLQEPIKANLHPKHHLHTTHIAKSHALLIANPNKFFLASEFFVCLGNQTKEKKTTI
jgi:hypothetical protein